MKFALDLMLVASGVISPIQSGASPRSQEPASPASATTAGVSNLKDRAPRYRLREGDSFEVQFAYSPEFNQIVTVQPDGYIALRSAGSIFVQDLPTTEVAESIVRAYRGILADPVVSLNLKDVDKPFFVVNGSVGKPGKYELRSVLTVTEGIAVAGGFTESSKHSQVVLFRPGPDGMSEARLLDLKKMLKARNLSEDVQLKPGDLIYVPQNRISKLSRYLPTSSVGLYGNPMAY
jgi:polysaccharide export outer membrane protein